jgi:hypothetical protein
MKFIHAELIHDVQKDHHAAGNTNGKTHDIDKRKDLVLFKIAPGYFQIILKHGINFRCFKIIQTADCTRRKCRNCKTLKISRLKRVSTTRVCDFDTMGVQF